MGLRSSPLLALSGWFCPTVGPASLTASSPLSLSSPGDSQLSSQVSIEGKHACALVHILACVGLDHVCLSQHVSVCVHVCEGVHLSPVHLHV